MTRHHPNHKEIPTFTPVQTQHSDGCGATACSSPTHDDIARRAYEIYIASGQKNGHCTQNWHRAEQALRDQFQVNHSAQQQSFKAVVPELVGSPL